MEAVLIPFIVLVLPLACIIAGVVTLFALSKYFALRQRELELRTLEATARVELMKQLPAWFHAEDPKDVAAWIATRRELVALTG